MKPELLLLLVAIGLSGLVNHPLAADTGVAGDDYGPVGHTTIENSQLDYAGVRTAIAGAATLEFTDTLFGVIAAPTDRVYRINAPYPGLVDEVYVKEGEVVAKGKRLLRLVNSVTLQRYNVESPAAGEVLGLRVNRGDRADDGVLLEVADLSMVWVEMSAFPESIEKLAVGQAVTVCDLHHHEAASGTINFVAPRMTGGHIARTRAAIANPDGHWRPGMHIKADILTGSREVPLAIEAAALQNHEGEPVVFTKSGNDFEMRRVKLGERDRNMIEILDGLAAGAEYVTANSFLIKADILKDGAGHDH